MFTAKNLVSVVICSIACAASTTLRAQQSPPIVFDSAAVESFPADVYPSQRTAVTRLAQQLAGELITRDGVSVKTIAYAGDGLTVHRDAILDVLRSVFPQARIESNESADLRVSARESDVVESTTKRPRNGRVTVYLTHGDSTAQASARFVEKPWADDWNLFRNSDQSKRWLMASSTSPAASEEEAIASAQSAAAKLLAPFLNETMKANVARSSTDPIIVTREWLNNRLLASVKLNTNGALVLDTFVQKFQRPYGDVWRASLLIDASQSNIAKYAERYNEYARADKSKERRKDTSTWGATAGIIVVIVLLYAFLNTVTRGYFLWKLRAAALLLAIAGLLIIFASA